MNTNEIYKLAKSLTEEEIINVLKAWAIQDIASFKRFHSLVSMGDSRQLAMATCIEMKHSNVDNYKEYYNAYCL